MPISHFLCFHDFFHALLNSFGLATRTAPSVDTSSHAGNDAHKIADQIVFRLVAKHRLDVASLHFHERRDIVPTEARATIPILHNDGPNAWISQEFEKL